MLNRCSIIAEWILKRYLYILPAWHWSVHQAVIFDKMQARLWETCALVVATAWTRLWHLQRETIISENLRKKWKAKQNGVSGNLAGRHWQPVACERLLVLEVPLKAAFHVVHRKSAHRTAQDCIAWGRKHPVKYPETAKIRNITQKIGTAEEIRNIGGN